ncbi:hypothetical protein K1T71_000111 [Dendrolimus kikuchii]|uniref:Uncharacterized protein n=1 Tax=Dendrolimus kikuchii TaxID=765133 RepID=A0ACC1DJ51_9NEOP|nr:hypothetical protein K1T71_000111 [Dendrolimus kikuchii]
MKYNVLGKTHMRVSELSLGGATFSDIYGTFNEDRSLMLIQECLRSGINYLETGPWYGQGTSERTIGRALREVPRQSYFIGSKVGRYEKDTRGMFDFSAERTRAGVLSTLQRLGLDYLDLIQIHDLSFADDINIILKETIPALEQAVSEGLVYCIGLADYDIGLMRDIIEETDSKISTVLSYSKSTLFDNRLQNYTSYFKSRGIGVINAAMTGMGLLTNKGPQPWHPASDDIKVRCQRASAFCKENGVELARLASWFTLSQPNIDTHVCGFHDSNELNSTLDILQYGLNEKEVEVLNVVQNRFFDSEPMHWDGVELLKYRADKEVAI